MKQLSSSELNFGRSTEKLETLPGQMNIFNEAEVAEEGKQKDCKR